MNKQPPQLLSVQSFGAIEKVLRALVYLYVPVTLALVVAWVVDDRQLLDENIWIKPFKFSVSIGLSGASFVWLLRRLKPTRWMRAAAFGSAAALVAEQVLITMQAGRGVRSHFNMDTSFDSTIYGMMGNFVGIVWLATLVLAIGVTRQRITDPVLRAVAYPGTWLVLLGASVGFVLVAAGKHTTGGVDGGPILPIVGWNRDLGDLRPAHFVGLHGLQVLIAVAWMARTRRVPPSTTARVVTAAAVSLAVLCLATLSQALTARPVISPSSWLIGLVTISAGVVTFRVVSRQTFDSGHASEIPVK
jgi:hypothetical protein